ncbi:M56 family metallopeptidase [Gemmatimonas groenlandica]|uniref:TonB-dependent receptor plug domain-containing protein n=1 Tax=Gemmatimonas groenlandica TaxID=2732249 RepID=A0A6M4IKU1_9BACT|nr:M56 family metallopeptidase [Gemmatimonas groenlandica]QJR34685.1 TonB-dependent receptor plug domain-containing protein [Gemmatimonas groenlandica]
MTPSLIIGWMTQAIVVSALLAAAALVLQRLAGRALPARVIWAGALFSSLVLVLVAPLRPAPQSTLATITLDVAGTATTGARASRPMDVRAAVAAVTGRVSRALSAPVSWTTTAVGGAIDRAPVAAQQAITLAWPLSSALVLCAFGVSYRRHRDELQRAARHEIDGVIVSVTEALGPAVIGVRSPRIAVPVWLLDRSDLEQRLVIAHEQSHIAAGDPLLLLASCGAIALMPWNPIAWFVLARLRLAIELDCDRRVIGTGASPRQYGQLLIELSSHVPQFMHGSIARTPLALTSPAFSYHASHLERRLITMTSRPSQFIRSRRLGSGLLATVALLAACESQLPTAAEMQAMDVKGVESRVAQVTKINTATAVYTVNGRTVSRAEANALSADSIATVNVQGGQQQKIAITTTEGLQGMRVSAADASDSTVRVTGFKTKGAAPAVINLAGSPRRQFTGILVLDGQRVESSILSTLNPDAIESIEVMKGDAAKAIYGDAGVNGVIKVTTKKK